MPRAPLERRFGKTLLARLDQALGRAAEPFDPIVPEEPPSAILRFARADRHRRGDRRRCSANCSAGWSRPWPKPGSPYARLSLICHRVDGAEQEIAIGTARASRDGDHLLRLLVPKIETIEPGFGIEAMRLVAGRVRAARAAADRDAADRRQARVRSRASGRPARRPSRREPPVQARRGRKRRPRAQRPPGRAARRAASWPQWPRPVRLLSPPERVDNVIALLPDLPPRRFIWRGRIHRVRRADGPERIHGEWWKRSGEADAVRDYFQVEDEEGGSFWLYRRGDGVDHRTGDLSWCLHGVFG